MKSRISFFNPTILKKDLTRFAPAWILYTVILVLLLWTASSATTTDSLIYSIITTIGPMSWVHMVYALLCAQLLFGDLFNSRLCNALHAMPMRREIWFVNHVVSGLAFAFIPHAIAAVMGMVLTMGGAVSCLWWLLGATLEHLFFFGLAVLSMLVAGNRFAGVVVYGLANSAALLCYWLVDTLYISRLYGFVLDYEPFIRFTPVLQMTLFLNPVDIDTGVFDGNYVFTPNEGWDYLWICAGIGLGLLALAVLFYRRRHLETAGDFVSVRFMGPVFLLIYSLSLGALAYILFDWMTGNGMVYMFIGLAIGYFTGQMLLKRTVKVMTGKIIGAFAAFALVVAMSLVVVAADPFNVVGWIPEAEDVDHAILNANYGSSGVLTADRAEEIETVIRLHEAALDPDDSGYAYMRFDITYVMKNGTRVSRVYHMAVDEEMAAILGRDYSTMEHLFGPENRTTEMLLENLALIQCDYGSLSDITPGEYEGLLAAFEADCEAGNMAQLYPFHYGASFRITLTFYLQEGQGVRSYDIDIYESATNTVQWLTENGYLIDVEYGIDD